MKKTKEYRAGRKQQHRSLLLTDTFTPPFDPADIKALSESSGDTADQLEKMIGWTEALLDSTNLPNGTKLKFNEIDKIDDPLVVAGLHARQKLVLVQKFLLANDHASAFNALLSAVPALMNANIVQHEDKILRANKSEAALPDAQKTGTKNTRKKAYARKKPLEDALDNLVNDDPEILVKVAIGKLEDHVKPLVRKACNSYGYSTISELVRQAKKRHKSKK